MPRWNGFGRSLVFAALAAAGLPVAVTFGGPLVGSAASVRLYLIVVAGCYAVGLAAGRSRRLAALAIACGVGFLLMCLPLGLAGTALGAAAIVAAGRSGIATPRPGLRTGVLEALFGAAGLCVAGFLATGGLLPLALAIWGYFLVQSAWFLIGSPVARGTEPERDAFEVARARLERLLEEPR